MTSRPVVALYGVLWSACGLVIRLSPPIADGWVPFGQQLVGWLVAVSGVFALLTSISRTRSEVKSPRRRLDDGVSRRREIGLLAAAILAVLMGGGMLWWGFGEGERAVLCAGLVVLSAAPILLVQAARSAHFGDDAAHRLS